MKTPNIYDIYRFIFHLKIIKEVYNQNNYQDSMKLSGLLINELNQYNYIGYLNSETLMYGQKSSINILFNDKILI